jgi:membrane protein YqaA with SNARE-associated domain
MEETPAILTPTPQKKNIIRRLYDWVLSWAETRFGTPALFILAFIESSVFPVPPDVLQIALSTGKPKRAFWYATVSLVGSVAGAFLGFLIGYLFWSATQDFFYNYVFSRETFAVVAGDEKSGITRLRFNVEAYPADTEGVMNDIKNIVSSQNISYSKIQQGEDAFSVPPGEVPTPLVILTTYETQADTLRTLREELSALPCVIGPIVEVPVMGLYHEHGFMAIFISAPTPIPYKLFTIAAGVCEISLWTLFIASVLGRGARFYAVAAIMYYFGPTVKIWIDKYFNLLMIVFTILVIAGIAAIKLFV